VKSKEFFHSIVLDEDVPDQIGSMLKDRGFRSLKHYKGASDRSMIDLSVELNAPLMTRDRDFIELHHETEHSGILIDSYMHLREWRSVADVVSRILSQTPRNSIQNELWYLSAYYGDL